MPRGSKIGERRGGRDRGTPNRRTLLVDRILAIASEYPMTPAAQFIQVLANDQRLPADIRMAIARGISPAAGPRASASKRGKPKSSSGHSSLPSGKPKQANLQILLGIVQDTTAATDQRRKAALAASQYFLPKKPGMKRWWINAPRDKYGFAITPEIAAEYRDARFELRQLERSESYRTATTQKVEKLRARIKTIQRRLQCPCPSSYGRQQIIEDRRRLIHFLEQRAERTLSAEENAEEAHRRARLDTFDHGPESAAQRRLYELNEKARIAKNTRKRLTRKERADLRFLRVLYSVLPERDRSSDESDLYPDEPYYPFRHEQPAEDGNFYPPNSKLRLLNIEGFEEFSDLPPYCYPPTARLPPLKEGDKFNVDEKGFRWSYQKLG